MALSSLEQDTLRAFRERAASILGDRLVGLVLFGSRARGEGDEESDLDVLVLARSFTRDDRRALIDAAHDLSEASGLLLAPVVRDEAGLSRSFPLKCAVERDGISL